MKLLFVRFCYCLGAVMDIVNFLAYLFPRAAMEGLGLSFDSTPALGYILIHAASLMLAWTLLLVWGFLKPIERRGVLLITVPICLGMEASAWYLVAAKAAGLGACLPLIILPLALSALFASSWIMAGRLARESRFDSRGCRSQ